MSTSINPRVAWPHEAKNFTPWLTENMGIVNGLLDMDLVLEKRERYVGRFRADIVAVGSSGKVVIEAQLGTSNHSHLGQCLTYAACLEAPIIIWIATAFTDEHLKALEMLNARNALLCYAVMFSFEHVETFYTPHFQVVCSPARQIWTKGQAVARVQMNAYLQQALHLEPRLRAVIDDAIAQENVEDYGRIQTYYALKPRVIPLVGFKAERPELRTIDHFDAVIETIYDLLPADDVELYPDDVDYVEGDA